MNDALRKVQPGQRLRIAAATYNAFVDAARDLRARQQRQQQNAQPRQRHSGEVLIKNLSGGDVAQFGVLGIDGVLFTPADNPEQFKNRVVLKGSTPQIASHTGRFAVLAEPIRNGEIGRAYVAGVFVAKVEITNAADQWADVKASTAELKTGGAGAARILWKESGTGSGKWAVVHYPWASGVTGAGSKNQVLQIIDDFNTIGWGWVRFANVPNP